MFSPAVSYSQQQTEENSVHLDSDDTDSENGNLPKTELVEEKEQSVECGDIQMGNEPQQSAQPAEGERPACASTGVWST